MTEEERMAYYRKKYGFEPKKQEPVEQAPVQETAPQQAGKSEKKGFFRRIFGKRR